MELAYYCRGAITLVESEADPKGIKWNWNSTEIDRSSISFISSFDARFPHLAQKEMLYFLIGDFNTKLFNLAVCLSTPLEALCI